jgi:hypothetical protein
MLVKVKDNLESTRKRQRTLKKQYLDVLQDTTNPEAIFSKVIKQLVTIKL